MGGLMKEAMAKLGGRGGGSKDMAQGGAPVGSDLETTLKEISGKLGSA
jgi:alanyl-tRNA synthetase